MTTTKAKDKQRERRKRLGDCAAIPWVRRAILESVREIGGEIIRRPAIRGRDDLGTVEAANPGDGMVAARAIEHEAAVTLRRYMRDARETGMGWRKIGELLELEHEAKREDISVAQAAFDLAAPRESYWAMTYGRSFKWTCRTCGADVDDEGPEIWASDFRRGHIRGCQRLAAEIREANRGRD